MAAFIAGTKGGNISALLPLLGLDQFGDCCRKSAATSKAIIEESKLSERKNDLLVLLEKRNATFGKLSDNEIEEHV